MGDNPNAWTHTPHTQVMEALKRVEGKLDRVETRLERIENAMQAQHFGLQPVFGFPPPNTSVRFADPPGPVMSAPVRSMPLVEGSPFPVIGVGTAVAAPPGGWATAAIYPPDGGLGPQRRGFDETLSAFQVMGRAIEEGRMWEPEPPAAAPGEMERMLLTAPAPRAPDEGWVPPAPDREGWVPAAPPNHPTIHCNR